MKGNQITKQSSKLILALILIFAFLFTPMIFVSTLFGMNVDLPGGDSEGYYIFILMYV